MRSRVNNGGDNSILRGQVWQYSNQSLRKHGLACTGRTNEQHVVSTGCSNFTCMTRRALSTHIGHVGNVVWCLLNTVVRGLLPLLFSANATNQFGKVGYRTNGTT
jgi:hypothetical protein